MLTVHFKVGYQPYLPTLDIDGEKKVAHVLCTHWQIFFVIVGGGNNNHNNRRQARCYQQVLCVKNIFKFFCRLGT